MNSEAIKAKLAEMSKEQHKDWYYLATQAMNGKKESLNLIDSEFGDRSMLVLHTIISICGKALSPAERQSDYNQAARALQMITNAPLDKAEEVADSLNAEIAPLLAIRVAKGLTQLELSRRSGVNPRQIRRIETGEAKIGNITLANAAALAHALGVGIEDLIKGEQDHD